MSELSTAQKRRRLENSNSIDPSDTVVVMDTSTESSKEIIDPDGDVILVLADTELQVSSKALSLASSVFKAMFGPHFQEGQDLSVASPKRISLPEDDVAAMITICNIIHHRPHEVIRKAHHTTLMEIGVLCDKYDCSEALELWSTTWLAHYQLNVLSRELGMHEASHLLFSFFAFNDWASFRQVSLMVVYRSNGMIIKPMVNGSLPDGLLELLQRKKREIECQLSLDMATMVGPILDCQQQHNVLGDGDIHKLGRHFTELRRLGLWPISNAFKCNSISTVCRWLETYKHETVGPGTCTACSIDLERIVRKAGLDAMESFKGLCLDCTKLGITETGDLRECSVHKILAEGSGGILWQEWMMTLKL